MNIDIYNALTEVYDTCAMMEQSSLFEDMSITLSEIVEYDIISFIERISQNHKEERVFYFSQIYFDGRKIKRINLNSAIQSKSIPFFVLYDRKNQTNTYKTIEALFMVIGKHFMFSRTDKKDINRDSFMNYMTEMKKYSTTFKQEKEIVKLNQNKPLTPINNSDESKIEEEKSLQELLDELYELVGLEQVKSEIKKRINQIKVDMRREAAGYKKTSMSLHLVFTGNPGTGKTTVARKLAAIYKALGVLSKGHFVEVDRSGLVGGYVGSTAIKTQEVIEKAMGGILFIDEAYTLTHDKGSNDFGQEAIDTILKAMEDHRDDFVVIVAGYTNEMKQFIQSNPGLESRFNKYIEFDDYTDEELYEIFKVICKNDEKIIHEECEETLKLYFKEMALNKPSNFANGRAVRNYYEKVLESLNERLVEDLDGISDEDLQIIRLVDLKV